MLRQVLFKDLGIKVVCQLSLITAADWCLSGWLSRAQGEGLRFFAPVLL